MKLLFFVSEDWYFCSHRLPLAVAARAAGYEVVVVTRVQEHARFITQAGLKLIPIPLSRAGTSLYRELLSFLQVLKIYRAERPDLVHHVAMKPVLYGSLAAWLARVPAVVNALAGLGYLFVSNTVKARVLRWPVQIAFRLLLGRGNSRLILQNPDDFALFKANGLIDAARVRIIRGSGVDTATFMKTPEPVGEPVVLLASRMLWDKGVGEFVAAARQLKQEGVRARFALVGEPDSDNPHSISPAQLEEWQRSKDVEWWGHREDMPAVFSACNVVVLPSYREGLPKVLLEAAACGRPIVATDVPGCREIVRDGDNGLLVPARDSSALAGALRSLIADAGLRQKMGARGRQIVEAEFSVGQVVASTLALYRELSAGGRP